MHRQGSSPVQIHHERVVYYRTIVSSSLDPYSNRKSSICVAALAGALGGEREINVTFHHHHHHHRHVTSICTFKTHTSLASLLTRYGLLILEVHAANDGRHTQSIGQVLRRGCPFSSFARDDCFVRETAGMFRDACNSSLERL